MEHHDPDVGRWEGCRAYWATMAIDTKKESWELVSSELASKQEASQVARKELTEMYKSFRKLPEDEKLASMGPLHKAFQDEVDALTRRSRLAEKSFLQMVADFLEAPDPTLFLQAGLEEVRAVARLKEELSRAQAETRQASAIGADALAEAAIERQRLLADVADLERELAKLRNQDITLREMESRIADFEGTMESQIAARLAEREAELRKVFESELEAVSFRPCTVLRESLRLGVTVPLSPLLVQVREAETAAEARVAALQSALTDAVSSRDEAQVRYYRGCFLPCLYFFFWPSLHRLHCMLVALAVMIRTLYAILKSMCWQVQYSVYSALGPA
jgi:hypothetical protein